MSGHVDGSLHRTTHDKIDNHIANIEREAEVLKNVLRDLITTLCTFKPATAVAHKLLTLRDELEAIFPKSTPMPRFYPTPNPAPDEPRRIQPKGKL